MKRIINTIPILLLFCIFGSNLYGQNSFLRQKGHWTFGINGGWAYQQADVDATLEGYGFGLTLAKNMFYAPNRPLSFDLRGRFLYANTYGLDRDRSLGILNNDAVNGTNGNPNYLTDPGFIYANHNTKIAELGLEGVIHLNRLRERTNFDISLYGGIGLDWYKTKTNQLNDNGTSYANNYTTANSRSDLRSFLDDTYETNADGFTNAGRLKFMPSLGAELYYWMTPRFALGLGHRVTFAQNDILDGQQWNADNTKTAENDRYHYTSLGLKWIISADRRQIGEPIIDITRPASSPYNAPDQSGIVRATIKNVDNPSQVSCTVNGRRTRFDFYGENFSTDFKLRPGNNEVIISASNSAGSDEASVIIIYQDTYIPPPPPSYDRPSITFINPPRQNANSNQARFDIKATVNNVDSKRDIEFSVNGQMIRDFDYSSRTRTFSAPINLRTGKNEICIVAKNRAGKVQEDVYIYYEEATKRPVVEITQPRNNPSETNQRNVNIKANIRNIDSKQDIIYTINGRSSNSFSYDNRRSSFTADIRLDQGRNTVRIEARNSAGRASDEVSIIYDNYTPPPPTPKPSVRITSTSEPTSNPMNPNAPCKSQILANVSNVNSKNEITFKINNRSTRDFDYNSRTGKFQATVTLADGRNDILIEARNNAGSDSDRSQVSCSGASNNNDNNNTKPQITITEPSRQSTTVREEKVNLKATIKNVDSKNDISILVNGKRFTNFNYSNSSKKLQAVITVKSGNNDILVRAQNKYGKTEEGVAVRYLKSIDLPTSKPPVVSITAPNNNSTSNAATTTLKATIKNVTNKSDISIKVNNKTISNFSFNNEKLSATVNLSDGNNTIVVKANNKDGNDDASVKIRYNAPKPKPSVSINSPRNNSVTKSIKATIKASVTNATKQEVTFTVNGKRVTNFSLNGSSFSANVDLKRGKNAISIKASNAGGSDQANINVTYEMINLVSKPTIQFVKPSRNGTTTQNANAEIVATIKNVKDKKGVTLKVNNKVISRFSFDTRSGKLTVNTTLKEGKNKIEVLAKNESGNTSKSTDITLKKKAVVLATPPIVKITSVSEPTANPMNPTVAKSQILASLKNVNRASQITFTQNGKKITDFKFNSKTGVFDAIIILEKGANKLVLKASNQDGNDQDSRTINF